MTKNQTILFLLFRKLGQTWQLFPAFLFLGFFFVYPVVLLLSLSFLNSNGEITLEHYGRLATTPLYFKVLVITLKTAGWTTLLAVVGGYPVAYLLASVRPSTRNSLLIWVLMPFWTSFLVRTFAWIVLLGRNGAVNDLLQVLGIIDRPLKIIYNFTGVLIGMTHALMPLAVLTMLSVMLNINANLPKAASTLGARGGQVFWRIFFPLSLPGVAAGGLLVFITSIGFFITPALLGGMRDTMIVQVIIFQIHEVLNWKFAGAVSMLLLLTVLLIFYFYDRLLGLSTLSGEAQQSSAKSNRLTMLGSQIGMRLITYIAWFCEKTAEFYEWFFPLRPDSPQRKFSQKVLWVTGLFIISFLALPTFFIIPVSFTEEGFLSWPPKGFSLQWYEQIFSSLHWFEAIGRSFLVASCSSLLGMFIGVPAAFFLIRKSIPGKTLIFAFLISPMILPHIIIAVAIFFLFANLSLVGTTFGLVLGHTVLAIPFVVVTVMAVIKNYNEHFDQAAWTLGATRLKTLIHITFPLIRPGLIAAFMFAFIISLDELTIALFITGGEVTTLPKQMWDDAIMRVSPLLAAVASLLLVFMSGFILLSEFLRRRGVQVK
ncbi:MAG: ABC transporter permease subunit [SAR324 cluster bacterium]|jgi:ABC-type spermidine/putrescine transport system permease subunit I|nr:ABC transporter permease subunit [SAR324 cluster bacterium]|tara:strand:+ start:2684 stop:4477 length:1794 start_codon:yes stop_codon:yes gene_type:complete